jgi:hypothetical protein
MNAHAQNLQPNLADISTHFYALFPPAVALPFALILE